VGKTSSPENFTSLINDVKSRIFDKLPDDAWFYPGHGHYCTLGAECPKLEGWRPCGVAVVSSRHHRDPGDQLTTKLPSR
jgi:glyoxylase-like metal-dependent hydrolase (beta-lactamase superfamily II)